MTSSSSAANSSRIAEVDAVRGLALGGMLLVNLGAMGAASLPQSTDTAFERVLAFSTLLLADGKFYPLFALLFGWGIARRQKQNNAAVGRFFWSNLRRMGVLAVFGLLHAVLLWQGDILFVYAVLGMALPLVRRAPSWMIIATAAICVLLSSFFALPGFGMELSNHYSAQISPIAGPLVALTRAPEGIPAVLQRLAQFSLKLLFAPGWLGNYAGLILAGYAAGLHDLSVTTIEKPYWKWLVPAFILNFLFALTITIPELFPAAWGGFLSIASWSLGGPLLGLGYAYHTVRAWRLPRWKPVLVLLANLGRMPLTAYLTQSLIGKLLFTAQDTIYRTPVALWLLAVFILLAQVIFANAWLTRFSRGPLETAWRWLSKA